MLSNSNESLISNQFKLEKAYPNPFNNEIKIPYKTNSNDIISAKIFNLKGQSVVELYSGKKEAGNHSLTWNGLNNLGQEVPSGTYLLVVDNEQKFYTQKLLLLK